MAYTFADSVRNHFSLLVQPSEAVVGTHIDYAAKDGKVTSKRVVMVGEKYPDGRISVTVGPVDAGKAPRVTKAMLEEALIAQQAEMEALRKQVTALAACRPKAK